MKVQDFMDIEIKKREEADKIDKEWESLLEK